MAILVEKRVGMRKVRFSSMAYCVSLQCRVAYTSVGQQLRK